MKRKSDVSGKGTRFDQKISDIPEMPAGIKDLYNDFYDNVPLGYQSLDIDGNLIEVNKEWLRILGYDREEVMGKGFGTFLVAGMEQEFQKSFTAFKQQGRVNTEFKMIHKDGSHRFCAFSGLIESDAGNVFVRSHCIIQDITIRKSDEEKMLRSDRIFNHSLDMLCIAGFDGFFKTLNPSWEKVLGWSTEELLSKPWNDFVHPDDIERTNNIKAEIVNGNVAYQFENRYLCKGGQYKWLSWNSFPYSNEKILIGVARDVTEKKELEVKLIHFQSLLRYIIEHNSTAIAVFDRTMRYIYVSQRFINDYGIKERSIIGKSHYEIFPEIPARWKEIHQRSLSGEIMRAERDPFVRSDGSLDWIRWECRPWFESDNSIGGIILYSEVITDRIKSEDELRNLKDDLEIKVKEKTKELEERINELERFHEATIERELRMKELKDENARLKKDLLFYKCD